MDSEQAKRRDEVYRRMTADDPSGAKRAIWETAFYWGRRQGYIQGQQDLRDELTRRLLQGDD